MSSLNSVVLLFLSSAKTDYTFKVQFLLKLYQISLESVCFNFTECIFVDVWLYILQILNFPAKEERKISKLTKYKGKDYPTNKDVFPKVS